MLTTPSLLLLPGPLWPRAAVPDKVPSMDQIKLFEYLTVWKQGMLTTPSLLLLPGPLWPRVTIPDKVPSMDQIKLFEYLTVWNQVSDVELIY